MSNICRINCRLAAVAAMAFTVAVALAADPPKADKSQLPEAAVKALKDAFPKATIGKIGSEKESGVDIFTATLKQGKAEMTVHVTADGTIVAVDTPAAEKELSEAAAKAVKSAAEGAKITDVVKAEIRAEVPKDTAKFTKLEKPKTAFLVTLTKETKMGTLKVADDGAVIGKLAWKDLTHAAGEAAPGKLVIRVNCGAKEDYKDLSGVVWSADQMYSKDKKWGASDGRTDTRQGVTISGTDAPGIYLCERSNLANYRFDVPAGKYTVRVHFCETWEGASQPGQRGFGVKIQGNVVLKDFDCVREVGFLKPYVKEVKDVEVTADGKLVVEFIHPPVHQHPMVDAIEVIGQ